MSGLRILLVERDGQQTARLTSALERASHLPVPVPTCEEAAEALLIQKFDVVLVGAGHSAGALTDLVAKLRQLEANGRGDSRASVLSYAAEAACPSAMDGILPFDFDAVQLAAKLNTRSAESSASQAEDIAVFNPEDFAEQCAGETSLMIEIIDIFEGERNEQLGQMGEALGARDFDRLSRLAHTMKGSVGALHAQRARQSCQALELAAREQNEDICKTQLAALDDNLTALAEPLAAFRAACVQH